ncbi:MAG TPA: hypothetical protein VGO62_07805, partial [Myxococcota bacterium]
ASYLADKGSYTKDLGDSGAGAYLDAKRYGTVVVDVKKGHFLARATGIDDMKGDVWEVDESGTPKNTADLCATLK